MYIVCICCGFYHILHCQLEHIDSSGKVNKGKDCPYVHVHCFIGWLVEVASLKVKRLHM